MANALASTIADRAGRGGTAWATQRYRRRRSRKWAPPVSLTLGSWCGCQARRKAASSSIVAFAVTWTRCTDRPWFAGRRRPQRYRFGPLTAARRRGANSRPADQMTPVWLVIIRGAGPAGRRVHVCTSRSRRCSPASAEWSAASETWLCACCRGAPGPRRRAGRTRHDPARRRCGGGRHRRDSGRDLRPRQVRGSAGDAHRTPRLPPPCSP